MLDSPTTASMPMLSEYHFHGGTAGEPAKRGVIVTVRGAVVDVVFDGQVLPPVNTELVVEWDRPEALVLEVHSYVDPITVRGIALQATSGLARGTKVRATGEPISVPVGEAVLGRLLDVVGTVRDRGPALPADTPRRSIPNAPRRHLRMKPQRPPCLKRLSSN